MNLADAIAQRLELRRGEARDLALEVVEILHQAGRWIGRKGLVRIEDANQGVAVVVGQEELVAPVAGCRGVEEKAGPDLVGDEPSGASAPGMICAMACRSGDGVASHCWPSTTVGGLGQTPSEGCGETVVIVPT